MKSDHISFEVTKNFADFLLKNPHRGIEVRDVDLLPHPKELILNSLALEMANEDDTQIQASIIWHATMLASYQENVGPVPVNMLGLSPNEIDQWTAEKSPESKLKWAKKIAESQDRKTYEKFSNIIEKERKEFGDLMMTCAHYLNASESESDAIIKIITFVAWIKNQELCASKIKLISDGLRGKISPDVDLEKSVMPVLMREVGAKEFIELVSSLKESSKRIKLGVFSVCREIVCFDEEEGESEINSLLALMHSVWDIENLS